jgi:hypothetical protein
MKIYDCFPFYNELDLLELRLRELYDHVDHFVLVEATTTFQRTPKELYFEKNKDRYTKYIDKIIHVIVDDAPGDPDAWVNDIFQRDSIMRGLQDADPEDIIIVEDADEILRPEVIDHIRTNPKDIMGFRVPYFNFKLNYMLINNNETYHVWTVACKRKLLESPNSLRNKRFQLTQLPMNYEDETTRMYEHAGWHFTYFGDTEFVRNKLKSFAHAELNNPSTLSQINVDDMIDRGVGFNPHDQRPFVKVAVDEYLPNTVVSNLDHYQQFLLITDTKSAREYLSTYLNTYGRLK